MNRPRLEKIARLWRNRITARDALLATAFTGAAAILATLCFHQQFLLPIGALCFVAAFALGLATSRPWKLDAARIARHLDRSFPELEESSALWLRSPDSLNVVERLQRQRADTAARNLGDPGTDDSFAHPPGTLLRRPLLWLAVASVLFAAVFSWQRSRRSGSTSNTAFTPLPVDQIIGATPAPTTAPPQVLRAELAFAPPAYTGRPNRRISGLNAEVEEGATVTWTLLLDAPVTQPRLVFGATEAQALPLQLATEGNLQASRLIMETALYSVAAVTADGAAWNPPELYSLKVIKDQPPALKILQPALSRTELTAEMASAVGIEIVATDDYAIADAYLVATVAKGTGEAVKFREERIAFDTNEPTAEPPGRRRLTKILDLVALGLEAGDELYFYVEATDNRAPISNRVRTETRFIALKGPGQILSAPGTGVAGVNLVPEYFRSQRQIIIDTEKLIGDRPTLSDAEVRRRSNNLGIDQQMLRQRYGQFLGEEVELGEGHSLDDGHDHGASPRDETKPITQEQLTAEFGHQHDTPDEGTLFDRETKGTMRQALAAMWEAERFLRGAQLAEALPAENLALEILKALQQSDRAYVQRVGFEPAPINFAERRLRGDVSAIPPRAVAEARSAPATSRETEARDVLRLAPWSRAAGPISSGAQEALRKVEEALIEAATQSPERFLPALQELRALRNGPAPVPNEQSKLKQALLQMLPKPERQPVRPREVSPALALPYFEALKERGPGS